MKTNLKDVTFLIPIRIDSIVRLENLILTVNFICREFDTNITVLEASNYKNGIIKRLLGNKVDYLFFEDKDPVFYRTKYLNIMTSKALTPIVGIWDADVLIPKEQIVDSINKIKEGFEIAYPYDGRFFDTSNVIRELYIHKQQIKTLINCIELMSLIYGPNMKGGAMFVNKVAYQNAGMENENFYGWGPEDWERAERWEILNYNVYCCNGPLFHLSHSRGNNSTFRSIEQVINTNKVLLTTKFSSKNELMQNTTLE